MSLGIDQFPSHNREAPMKWIIMLMLVLNTGLAQGQEEGSIIPAKVMGEAGQVRVVLTVNEFPQCEGQIPLVKVTRDELALGVKVVVAGPDSCASWETRELEIQIPGLPMGRYTVASEVLQVADPEDRLIQSYDVLEAIVGTAGVGAPGEAMTAWIHGDDGNKIDIMTTWFDKANDPGPPGQPTDLNLR